MNNPKNIYNQCLLPRVGLISKEKCDNIYSSDATYEINKFRREHGNPENIIFHNYKIIVKKSDNICEGDGVYADEDIPTGAIIDIQKCPHEKINDLAHNDKNYHLNNVREHTNCKFLCDSRTLCLQNFALLIIFFYFLLLYFFTPSNICSQDVAVLCISSKIYISSY